MTPRGSIIRAARRLGYDVRRHEAYRRVQLLNFNSVDLVLDVGAARGDYARELRRFGYTSAVTSFEPLRQPFAVLRSRARHDQKWRAINVALGSTPQSAYINVAGNSDSSSFLPMLDRHTDAAPHAAYHGVEEVCIATLDDLAPDILATSRRPFLKMDTQGFEGSVLDGGALTIERLVGIQTELSFVPLYDGAQPYSDTLDRIRGAGFELMGIEPGFLDKRNGQLLQADALFFRQR